MYYPAKDIPVDEIRKLRSEGKTYTEIGQILGCSRQNAYHRVRKDQKAKFKGITRRECIYDGLRFWMNQNLIDRIALSKIIYGKDPGKVTRHHIADKMSGAEDWDEWMIEKLVQVTGRAREYLF